MSKSVNKCILLGNLTRDPESRYTTSGKAVCTVALATNERTKKDGTWVDVANYHTIILWDKLAETAQAYLKKGNRALFEGRIQTRSYEKDGVKRYTTEIVASDLVLLEKAEKTEPSLNPQVTEDESVPF